MSTDDKLYCWKCGAQLVLAGSRKDGYDGDTGIPIFILKMKCPNDRWWHIPAHRLAWVGRSRKPKQEDNNVQP